MPTTDREWLFQYPKLILLGSGVLFAGLTAVFYRQQLKSSLPRWAIYLLVAYLGWTMLTNTVLSSQPAYTLLGWVNWNGGYVTTSLYVLTLLLASLGWRDGRDAVGETRWLWILFGFSAVMAAICVLEMLGFSPVLGSPWFAWQGRSLDIGASSFPISTIGNSGWVAGLWLLLAPLPYLLKKASPAWSLAWHGLIALGVGSVHSKAVLFTYVAMHLAVAAYQLLSPDAPRGRAAARPMLLAATCIVVAWTSTGVMQSLNAELYERGVAGRLNSKIDLDQEAYRGSAAGRLAIYKASWRLIKERPLQGWGLETLQHRFYDVFTPAEYRTFIGPLVNLKPEESLRRFGSLHVVVHNDRPKQALRMQFFDIVKPHNVVLEEIYSNGLVGLLLLASALGLIVRQILVWGRFQEKMLLLAVTLYFVYLLLWFTTIAVTPLACVLLAFASRGAAGRAMSASQEAQWTAEPEPSTLSP
ncbi:O-antigen ligase [Deinococcus sp. HSC-46F16]|uniref:O-antigen ligase family protein n=1 Tax=Deinococcus sp. HSC-46F16 TaxID=2910968 RepID=UPI0020A05739|nr:O-antigen ligase family protein [Deinococcus sp. HSC-46F16]MCP2014137.1 O-antigen ligase [Deinococcus sp. HSC-46F16]